MPFSSGRSVRAPASNATRTVTALVPGRSTRYSGSPLGSVEEWILAMAAKPIDGAWRRRRTPRQDRLQGGEHLGGANTLHVDRWPPPNATSDGAGSVRSLQRRASAWWATPCP